MLSNCGAGRIPRTARRSNQSILKEINLEYSLEGLTLKLQYFGHLMQRVGHNLATEQQQQRHIGNWISQSSLLSFRNCLYSLFKKKQFLYFALDLTEIIDFSALLWVSVILRKPTISSSHLYLKLQKLNSQELPIHFFCCFKLNRMKIRNKQK